VSSRDHTHPSYRSRLRDNEVLAGVYENTYEDSQGFTVDMKDIFPCHRIKTSMLIGRWKNIREGRAS
jgi:hypothetical protein